MHELIYTSARRGLKVGSRGFCTVAHTEGMPAAQIQLAESLSGYRNLYQPHDRHYDDNPVAFSHYLADVGGRRLSVLSRVSACGTDYSGRTNKIAHHLLLEDADRTAAGPAVVLSQTERFVAEWKDEPRLLPASPRLAVADAASFRANAWEAICGDAGWAGVLAQRHREAPGKDTYLVFEPGMDLLPLMREALALLPPDERWTVTFSTYFTGAPRHSTCHWRGCVKSADALRAVRGKRDVLIIDLTAPLPRADTGPLVAAARGETLPAWAVPPVETPVAVSRTKPPVKRKAAVPAAPRLEPGSVRLRGAGPPKSRTADIGKYRDLKPTRPERADPVGTGKLIGVACGVVAIVVGGICIWQMGPARTVRVSPPVAPHPVGANTSGQAVAPPLPDKPIVAEKVAPTATVATVARPPDEEEPPMPPSVGDVVDRIRPVDVIFRMHTFSDDNGVWHIAFTDDDPWLTYDYEFMAMDRVLNVDTPARDVDRLRNTVRSLNYRLDAIGLRARIMHSGITFDRLGGGTPNAEQLTCVRVLRPDRDADIVFCLNGIEVVGRQQADVPGAVVYSVAREGGVRFLETLLHGGTLRCQAGFDGTDLRRDLPCEAFTEGDALTLKVIISTDEQARILNVIRWQAEKKGSETASARRAARDASVWDRDRVVDTLSKLRREVGEDGVLTQVRRQIVVRDLRTFLVDYCEARLQGAAAGEASAVQANQAMEALREMVRYVMWDADSLEKVEQDADRNTEAVVTSAADIRKRAGERVRFYRGLLLPSNRLLSDDKLRDILQAGEWDALTVADPVEDFGVEEPDPNPPEATGLVVSALYFYPENASHEPVLTVRCAGARAF